MLGKEMLLKERLEGFECAEPFVGRMRAIRLGITLIPKLGGGQSLSLA